MGTNWNLFREELKIYVSDVKKKKGEQPQQQTQQQQKEFTIFSQKNFFNKMPCQGCNSHEPGKVRCVVCDAKWCNNCLSKNAMKRNSGWKCNGCVGTSSRNKPVVNNNMTKCWQCNADVEKGKLCNCGRYN